MRAFQLSRTGTAPGLVDLPLPAPGPGELAVRIEACGLNFADLLMIDGKYQDTPPTPFVMGMEAAGVVTAAGSGTQITLGTRVAVFAGQGSLAEAGVFPEERCTPLPASMSATQAAAFQIAYGTSHVALVHRARLRPGETLAVLGAAGGVGLAAVELGKALGGRVVGAVSSEEKAAAARRGGSRRSATAPGPRR